MDVGVASGRLPVPRWISNSSSPKILEASRNIVHVSDGLNTLGLRDLNDDETTVPTFEASVRGCIKILANASKLELLRLILPCNFAFEAPVTPFKLDVSDFSNLKIMLVHLRRDDKRDNEPLDETQERMVTVYYDNGRELTRTYADLAAWAKAMG